MFDLYGKKIAARGLADIPKAVDPIFERARGRNASDLLTVAAETAIGTTIGLFKVKSSARPIKYPSVIYNQAFGADVTLDIGFAPDPYLDYAGDEDALADNLAIGSAGNKAFYDAVTTANLTKRFWELAGLSEDPNTDLWIMATIKGAETVNEAVLAFEAWFAAD